MTTRSAIAGEAATISPIHARNPAESGARSSGTRRDVSRGGEPSGHLRARRHDGDHAADHPAQGVPRAVARAGREVLDHHTDTTGPSGAASVEFTRRGRSGSSFTTTN